MACSGTVPCEQHVVRVIGREHYIGRRVWDVISHPNGLFGGSALSCGIIGNNTIGLGTAIGGMINIGDFLSGGYINPCVHNLAVAQQFNMVNIGQRITCYSDSGKRELNVGRQSGILARCDGEVGCCRGSTGGSSLTDDDIGQIQVGHISRCTHIMEADHVLAIGLGNKGAFVHVIGIGRDVLHTGQADSHSLDSSFLTRHDLNLTLCIATAQLYTHLIILSGLKGDGGCNQPVVIALVRIGVTKDVQVSTR